MSNWIPKIVYNSTTITFDYPPKGKDPIGEQYTFNGTVSESKSGLEQTIIDNIEINYDADFSHVSETIKAQLTTFLTTWGYLGKEFDYDFDKDDAGSKVTVTLPNTGRKVKFDIHIWDNSVSPRTPMYKFKLTMRRIL